MSTNLKMNEKHEACKELEGSRLYKIGVCAEPDYCFTHYLESGYKEEDILIETCETVTEKKTDTEIVKFKVFPGVGPDGGIGGGEIVFTGPPKEMSEKGETITARYLRK